MAEATCATCLTCASQVRHTNDNASIACQCSNLKNYAHISPDIDDQFTMQSSDNCLPCYVILIASFSEGHAVVLSGSLAFDMHDPKSGIVGG